MELKKLVERLEQLTGERVAENTIKTWAHTDEIIPKPLGGGKGGRVAGGNVRKAEWPPQSLEQAAAVWWVREKYRGMYAKKKKLSTDQINVIKRAASVLDESPFAIYHLPRIIGPLSTQHIAPEAITMTFVSDDFNGVYLFPGKKLQEKIRCLNTLLVAWVAAREKVRAWAYIGMSATYILKRAASCAHSFSFMILPNNKALYCFFLTEVLIAARATCLTGAGELGVIDYLAL